MGVSENILEKVKLLEEKYAAMGQDLSSYLDGLLHADYLTYWDYIHLDTLLSLQNPKTQFPDEEIFVIYHQITELYFKLIHNELDQITSKKSITAKYFKDKLVRINRYFENLIYSFDIMVDGMEPQQFLQFRMSLLPASGFQSAQYRLIEIKSTNFHNLLSSETRAQFDEDSSIYDMYEYMYWKRGGIELKSGAKTLTLRQFEKKYSTDFIRTAQEFKSKNLLVTYQSMSESDRNDQELIDELKRFDAAVNVNWCLSHYRSAVRYMNRDAVDIEATGGTNWQKFLPPRFQSVRYFPELWTEDEVKEWGKGWVDQHVFNRTEFKK